jgi:uncharacterized protein YkwD
MKHIKLNFLVSAFAATLVACGGGGGGSAPATPTTPIIATAPVAATTVPIVTSVPVSTYAAGSEEKAAFDLLNAERAACGFGLLAQNTALDNAARGHADWLLTNNYVGHYQAVGTPGFTGVVPEDRMTFAGYAVLNSFGSTEVASDTGGNKSGIGIVRVRSLLNAPYHMLGMVRGWRDLGISVRDNTDVSSSNITLSSSRLIIDFGSKNISGLQEPIIGNVRTYPCNGTTGVNRQLVNETPNPVPKRDLFINPLGSSIGVAIALGHTIAISNASILNAATGAGVVVRPAVTAANDPNATGGIYFLNFNEAFISADAPLAALTTYQATINGTDNGVAFSRTFSFTTGN